MKLEKVKGILDISDKYSYEVYLVHQLIILGPFTLLVTTESIVMNLILVVIGIILLTILLKYSEKTIYKIIEKT